MSGSSFFFHLMKMLHSSRRRHEITLRREVLFDAASGSPEMDYSGIADTALRDDLIQSSHLPLLPSWRAHVSQPAIRPENGDHQNAEGSCPTSGSRHGFEARHYPLARSTANDAECHGGTVTRLKLQLPAMWPHASRVRSLRVPSDGSPLARR